MNPFQVVFLSALIGTLSMAALAALLGERMPPPQALAWAGLAGVCGSAGLAALYRGLAVGNAAVVSPIAAVVGAAFPVILAALTAGLPKTTQLIGFGCALPGIALVSTAPSAGGKPSRGLLLGLAAGVCFGLFFIALANARSQALFIPLAAVKLASLLAIGAILVWGRKGFRAAGGSRLVLLAGLLDALGNALYYIGIRLTRIDIAAVLVSLYPAGTVILFRLILKEPIASLQWVGVGLCLAAIALITL